jgi:hypothetical protein
MVCHGFITFLNVPKSQKYLGGPSPPLKLIFDEKTCLAVDKTVKNKIRPYGEHCNSK